MLHLFSDTPVTLDANDTPQDGITLGTAWYSDHDGIVSAGRFYLGAHTFDGTTLTAALYSQGERVAWGQLTVTAATPLGYNSIPFAEPFFVRRNQWYVVAVFYPGAASGHYPATLNYFTAGQIDSGVLHAFKTDPGMLRYNGLFASGSSLTLPNETYQGSNYFIDIDFDYAALMNVRDSSGKYVAYPIKRRSGGTWVY